MVDCGYEIQISKTQDWLYLGTDNKSIVDKLGFYSLKAKENTADISELNLHRITVIWLVCERNKCELLGKWFATERDTLMFLQKALVINLTANLRDTSGQGCSGRVGSDWNKYIRYTEMI